MSSEQWLWVTYGLGWLATAVVIYYTDRDDAPDEGEDMGAGIMLGAVWPLLLAYALVVAAVIGVVWLIDAQATADQGEADE